MFIFYQIVAKIINFFLWLELLFLNLFINHSIGNHNINYTSYTNNNLAIFICGQGRGHFTQFINMYETANETLQNKIKLVFLNSNAITKLPQYFLEFCENNNIEK